VPLNHAKVSGKAAPTDTTKVGGPDWDAAHVFTGGALGSLLYRDTGDATNGFSWLADVATGSVLTSGGVGAAPAWSSSLHLYGSGATPSSGLSTSPLHVAYKADVGGAASLVRFENTSTVSTAATFWDFVCGDTAGSYVYGRFTVQSPNATDPSVFFGSGSNSDFVLVTNGGEILRFNRKNASAGPYFFSFGGATSSFPASKRESANWSFRLGDDSDYTGIVAKSLTLSSGTRLVTTSAAFSNGAGASTGTLTNAPAAGNPTKWIPISDNGVTRYIPAW
jgi:hypothetical protein